MSIQLPEWTRTMFLVFTGDAFPEADEDRLRVLAAGWKSAGTDLKGLVGEVDAATYAAVGAVQGVAAAEFVQAMQSLTQADPRLLDAVADACIELGAFIDKTALDVEYTKWLVIGELVMLAIQIAWCLASAYWSFGLSLVAIPALQALGRTLAGRLVMQLISQILVGLGMQLSLDVAVQLAQYAKHTRRQWDFDKTTMATYTGLVGAGVGMFLHGLFDGVLNRFGRFVGDAIEGPKLVPKLVDNAAWMFTRKGVGFGSVVLQGASHEWFTDFFTSGLVEHKWEAATPYNLTAGGLEEVFQGAGRGMGHRVAGHYGLNPFTALGTIPELSLDTLARLLPASGPLPATTLASLNQVNWSTATPAALVALHGGGGKVPVDVVLPDARRGDSLPVVAVAALSELDFGGLSAAQLASLGRVDFTRLSAAVQRAIGQLGVDGLTAGDLRALGRQDFTELDGRTKQAVRETDWTSVPATGLAGLARANPQALNAAALQSLTAPAAKAGGPTAALSAAAPGSPAMSALSGDTLVQVDDVADLSKLDDPASGGEVAGEAVASRPAVGGEPAGADRRPIPAEGWQALADVRSVWGKPLTAPWWSALSQLDLTGASPAGLAALAGQDLGTPPPGVSVPPMRSGGPLSESAAAVLHGVDWSQVDPQALAALSELDLATVTPTLVHLAGQIGRDGFTAGHAAALAGLDPATLPQTVRTALSRADVRKLSRTRLIALAEADPRRLTVEDVAALPQREDLPATSDPVEEVEPVEADPAGPDVQVPVAPGSGEAAPSLAALGASMLRPAGPTADPAPAVETGSPAGTDPVVATSDGAGLSSPPRPTVGPDRTGRPIVAHQASPIAAVLDGPAPGPSGPLAGARGAYFGTSSDDPAAVQAATAALPLFDKTFVAAAHMTPDGQRLTLPDGRQATAAEFADVLRQDPGYRAGQPVVLVACRAAATGGDGRSFAADLAAELGVDVIASAADVWQTTDGRVLSTASGYTADGRPIPVRTGGTGSSTWTLHPGGPGRTGPVDLGADLVAALTMVAPPELRAEPYRVPGTLPADVRWLTVLDQRQLAEVQAAGQNPPAEVTNAVAGFAGQVIENTRRIGHAPHIQQAVDGAGAQVNQAAATGEGLLNAAGAVQHDPLRDPADVPAVRALLAQFAYARVIHQAVAAARAATHAVADAERAATLAAGMNDAATAVYVAEYARQIVAAVTPQVEGEAAAARELVRTEPAAVLAEYELLASRPVDPEEWRDAAREYAESAAEYVRSLAIATAVDAAEPAATAAGDAAPGATRAPKEQQSAKLDAEWRIQQAQAAAQAAVPVFAPPPGIGEHLWNAGPDLHPSWGVRGRIERIGDILLGGPQGDTAVANLIGDVAQDLAAGAVGLTGITTEAFVESVRGSVDGRFAGMGSQFAGQLLAGDGMSFVVADEGLTYKVTVRLNLGDIANAQYVRPAVAEQGRFPMGEKQGTGADQLKEDIVVSGRGNNVGRSFGVTPQGPLGLPGFLSVGSASFNPGGSVGGSSGGSLAGTEVSVISSMKQLMYDGRSAYFDVPGSTVTVTAQAVDPATEQPLARAVLHTHNSQPLTVQLGYPVETPQPAGPAPQPGPVVGLPGEDRVAAAQAAAQAAQAAAQAAQPGQGAQAAQPVQAVPAVQIPANTPTGAAYTAAAERVERVLGRVFAVPQSITGLERLRERIHAQFPRHGLGFEQAVHHELNEAWLLQEWGVFAGAGRPSGWHEVGGGTGHWAGFSARARLRSIQRVDPTGRNGAHQLKLESRIGTQVASTEGGSGSASLTATQRGTFNWSGGPQPGQTHSLNLQLAEGIAVESGRSNSATVGGGEWRTANYTGQGAGGPSVLYRAEMRFTAELFSTRPNIAREVGADGIVYLRVPLREAARFEAAITQALTAPPAPPAAQPPVVQPPVVQQALPPEGDPQQVPLGPRDAQQAGGSRPEARIPPPEIEHDRGLGAGVIDRLGGGERVVDSIIEAVTEAERRQPWRLARSAQEQLLFRRTLAPLYSTEGLIAQGADLVSTRGVVHTFRRSVAGGTELIKVKVRPRRAGVLREPDPTGGTGAANAPRYGRVDYTSVDIIPTYYSEMGSNDTLSTRATFGLTGQGGGGLQVLRGARERISRWLGQGANVDLNYSRADVLGESTGVFSFAVRGALFDAGAVRTFDYDVNLDVDVDVTFHAGAVSRSWFGWHLFGQLRDLVWRRAGFERLPDEAPADPTHATRTVHDGLIRYVVPEALAPRPPAPGQPPAAPALLGTVTTTQAAVADPGELGRIISDDLIIETLGSDEVVEQVTRMLVARGMSREAIGSQIAKLGGPTALRAHLLRNPDGQLTFEVSQGGLFSTKRARVTLQAATFNELIGADDVRVRRLDILESQPKVEGSRAQNRQFTVNARPEPTVLAGEQANGGNQTVVPYLGLQDGPAQISTTWKQTHTGVSGRWLTHAPAPYRSGEADIVWTATTMVWHESLVKWGRTQVDHAFLRVESGLRFLRPQQPPPATNPPPGVPPRLTPNQFPSMTKNERLEFVPPAAQGQAPAAPAQTPAAPGQAPAAPDTAAAQNAARTNPLLAEVQRLLGLHSPGLLTRRWTIAGNPAERRGGAPETLQAMLNQGALLGHVDLMLGAGLVLRPARAWPLWISRPNIVIRATRDPAGYTYQGSLEDFSQGLYWTGYAKQDDRRRVTQAASGYAGARVVETLPDQPPGQHTPEGHRALNVLGIPQATVSWSESTESARSHTAIDRDTYRIVGPTDRYAGNLTLDITYVPASRPSRLLNFALLGLPAVVWSYAGSRDPAGSLAQPPPVRTGQLTVEERVLVPRGTQYTDTPLQDGDTTPRWDIVPAPPVPAVEEVRPGETLAETANDLGLRVMPVTPEHVLRRQVHVAHIDHGSIRDLADQALQSFTGRRATPGEVTGVGALPLPQWLRPTGTVARLLRLDGGGFAGFLNTITFPRLTRGVPVRPGRRVRLALAGARGGCTDRHRRPGADPVRVLRRTAAGLGAVLPVLGDLPLRRGGGGGRGVPVGLGRLVRRADPPHRRPGPGA